VGSRNDKKRTKRRRPHRPPVEPPPVIPREDYFHPRGGHKAPWRGGYTTFRERLGLGNTIHLARLLGVTVRSIQRWEYQGPAPRWYHAALLGLRDVWGGVTVTGDEGLRR